MKKENKKQILIWILSIIPFIIIAAVYSKLPNQVPSHWGIEGNVTYSGKSSLWFLGSLPAIMAVLLLFMPKIDPRKKNYEKFEGNYYAFVIFMMIFLIGLLMLVISESFYPGRISVPTSVVAACGLLFAFIGNMMPKLKSNFFMGVKTPWTLSNTEVWNKTHRLAGFMWFVGGIINIIIAFLLKDISLFITFFAIVILISVIPAVMSYVWYKKIENINNVEK